MSNVSPYVGVVAKKIIHSSNNMETPEVDWNMVILHMPMLESLPGEVQQWDGVR